MTPCRATSAGLVIVDAWTLATTRRLSPTFTRPRSLSLLGYGSGHVMSEPCLDGLVAGAALLDGGDGRENICAVIDAPPSSLLHVCSLCL